MAEARRRERRVTTVLLVPVLPFLFFWYILISSNIHLHTGSVALDSGERQAIARLREAHLPNHCSPLPCGLFLRVTNVERLVTEIDMDVKNVGFYRSSSLPEAVAGVVRCPAGGYEIEGRWEKRWWSQPSGVTGKEARICVIP